MIRIQDDRFQKKAMGGGLSLDRASVVVIGIDLRENRGGSPGIRCDIAYGIEDAQGKFQPFHYDDLQTTVPVYVEPRDFENYRASAARALANARASAPSPPAAGALRPVLASSEASSQPSAPEAGTGLRGQNLLEALTLWFEQELVDSGRFGPDAEVL